MYKKWMVDFIRLIMRFKVLASCTERVTKTSTIKNIEAKDDILFYLILILEVPRGKSEK